MTQPRPGPATSRPDRDGAAPDDAMPTGPGATDAIPPGPVTAWPAALVVNALAGTLSAMEAPATRIAERLRAAGFTLDDPEPMDTLDAQWAKAAAARVVFVAGGDGTLRDAASRLRGTGRFLAPLPGGTLNRLCTRLALPANPLDAADAYAGAVPDRIDAATANGDVFLYQIIIGRPTRLMRFREMQRGAGAGGWWPLAKALLRALLRPFPRNLWVRSGPVARHTGQAVVITLPEPGAPAALLLHVARPSGPLGRLRQAWRWFRGNLGQDADVAEREVARVAVHAREHGVRISLDGEMRVTRTPVRVNLWPRDLPVLRVPPPRPVEDARNTGRPGTPAHARVAP